MNWIPRLVAISLLIGSPALAKGKAEHIVIVVWDGLRPDTVNETNTPTLAKLARDGVFFANHHAVYLSSTEVNGVALVTGAYPNRNGVMANREYRPAIDPLKRIATEALDTVLKADEISSGRYLKLPTLAEILRRAGLKTAIAGSKPVVLLHDRADRAHITMPETTEYVTPNTDGDEATTRALLAKWDRSVPAFSLLWLSEPDLSQHDAGPGSTKALAALKSSDQNLALVLRELDAKGVRDKTDVFVVSDHGFSTIARTVDVAAVLKEAGFNAAREFKQPPEPGDIMVVGNGGSVLFYVIGHNAPLTQKLVAFLQQQDFVGVVFTREPMRGTFTLDQVRINTADASDVVISLRWADQNSSTGLPGVLVSDGRTRSPGQGNHTSLSRFDMHATLIAAGPSFRRGVMNPLPSSNADLVPTILHLLGVKPPQPMDGRVLTEALTDSGQKTFPPIEVRTLEAAQDHGKVMWRQYVRITDFGGAFYIDEGNGFSQAFDIEESPAKP